MIMLSYKQNTQAWTMQVGSSEAQIAAPVTILYETQTPQLTPVMA